jgi:hypothetical protein
MLYNTASTAAELLSFLQLARKHLRARKRAHRHRRGPRPPRSGLPPRTWDDLMAWLTPHFERSPELFKTMFRMDSSRFDQVAESLEALKEDTRKKGKHGRPIGCPERVEPKIALAMTLRYLAGGAACDIRVIFNVTRSTFKTTLKRTLEQLYDVLPTWALPRALESASSGQGSAELDAISSGFNKASHGFIPRCIGAIDGILIPIRAQKRDRTFYCRKGFHAMNVQAIADSHGRLIFAHVGATPGSAHDSFAWKETELCGKMRDVGEPFGDWLKAHGRHLIGDDAYASGHTMAVPWPGTFDAKSPKLAYNFVHSSARMCVERAFGMLCRKWLLLKRPYEGSLRRTVNSAGFHITVVVAMKLHNLAISGGDSMYGHLYGSDITGRADPLSGSGEGATGARHDHLGRAQAVDTGTVLFSGANPALALVEAAKGQKQAARCAREPAWEADHAISPRDPEKGLQRPCGPRDDSTDQVLIDADSRRAATEQMELLGYTRQGSVHWK